MSVRLALAWMLAFCAGPIAAELRLEQARHHRLANGLTVIVLEEDSLPSVSTQMLYRAGARDESYGATGLAHFLEHMAFRATANFPDTEVVSRIYAAGGEWHGYTWIDQTTYYATVPATELDLLLRIEADRMARLVLDPAHVEPERGAVLAELHGYENDPAAVLHDAVVATALQAHPYRNNVIGWESDVRAITHADLQRFYRRHYHPANAVLAIVGAVDADRVLRHVEAEFGELPEGEPASLPRTVEPRQDGVRRVVLNGAGDLDRIEIAWQAPAFSDPDFPAFLVLQEWLGGTSGVNFIQSFGTSPVREGSLLDGLAADTRTWFPPSEQTYLFSIAATVPEGRTAIQLESLIGEAVERVRAASPEPAEWRRLRQRVDDELLFDVQTHEDAAHQLAFFDGVHALDDLLRLRERVADLGPATLRAVARRWLSADQRTVGHFRARHDHGASAPPPEPGDLEPPHRRPFESAASPTRTNTDTRGAGTPGPSGIGEPELLTLPSGLPVIAQPSELSDSVHLRLVVEREDLAGDRRLVTDDPVPGVASLNALVRPDELDDALAGLRESLDGLRIAPAAPPGLDPAAVLEAAWRATPRDASGVPGPVRPRALAVSGRIDIGRLEILADRHFGDVKPAPRNAPDTMRPRSAGGPENDRRIMLALDRGQSQIGYFVPAPAPGSPDALAWQALLYVFSHGYEGRFGKEVISRRGLAYYVDGRYRSDGERAVVAITTGVDTGKLDSLEELFRAELARLTSEPPTDREVEEAKSHFLGRLDTAWQSNAERSGWLAREWLWHGRLPDADATRREIRNLEPQRVRNAVSAFTGGRFIIVEVGRNGASVPD